MENSVWLDTFRLTIKIYKHHTPVGKFVSHRVSNCETTLNVYKVTKISKYVIDNERYLSCYKTKKLQSEQGEKLEWNFEGWNRVGDNSYEQIYKEINIDIHIYIS